MKRSLATRMVLRALGGASVLAVASGLFAPAGGARGPYLSSLSDLTAGSALAAAPCQNKACGFDPRTLKDICVKSSGTTCDVLGGPKVATKCIQDPC